MSLKFLTERNVGGADLMVRALVGTLSVIALAMDAAPKPYDLVLALLAFVGLYTSITRHCTPYSIVGFSTNRCCKPEKKS